MSDAIKHLNITRVIVAHRPETIATADRVFSLETLAYVAPARRFLGLNESSVNDRPSPLEADRTRASVGFTTADGAELARLRRENGLLQSERDAFKAAATLLANPPG